MGCRRCRRCRRCGGVSQQDGDDGVLNDSNGSISLAIANHAPHPALRPLRLIDIATPYIFGEAPRQDVKTSAAYVLEHLFSQALTTGRAVQVSSILCLQSYLFDAPRPYIAQPLHLRQSSNQAPSPSFARLESAAVSRVCSGNPRLSLHRQGGDRSLSLRHPRLLIARPPSRVHQLQCRPRRRRVPSSTISRRSLPHAPRCQLPMRARPHDREVQEPPCR